MARKKAAAEEGGGQEWLATYGDMMTLLLCFFVLLFSMSSVDAAKFEQLVQAFNTQGTTMQDMVVALDGAAGIEGDKKPSETGNLSGLGNAAEMMDMVSSFDDVQEFISAVLESQPTEVQEAIEITAEDENTIMIRFKDNMMFRPNTAILLPEASRLLSPIGDALKAMEEYIAVIRVDGHCSGDISPTGSKDKFTWDLSTNRANTVSFYMQDKKGFNPAMMFSVGFGKYRPIASNDTEAERSRNRRVELYVKRRGMDLSDPDLLMDYFTMGYDVQDFEETAIGQEVFGG